jgi:hypothetical protein
MKHFNLCVLSIFSLLNTGCETPYVHPYNAVRIHQPFWGSPAMDIHCWHQNQGNLRKGVILVCVEGDNVDTNDHTFCEKYSFEEWVPNKENQRIFTVPLKRYDKDTEYKITCRIDAAFVRTSIDVSSYPKDYDVKK